MREGLVPRWSLNLCMLQGLPMCKTCQWILVPQKPWPNGQAAVILVMDYVSFINRIMKLKWLNYLEVLYSSCRGSLPRWISRYYTKLRNYYFSFYVAPPTLWRTFSPSSSLIVSVAVDSDWYIAEMHRYRQDFEAFIMLCRSSYRDHHHDSDLGVHHDKAGFSFPVGPMCNSLVSVKRTLNIPQAGAPSLNMFTRADR